MLPRHVCDSWGGGIQGLPRMRLVNEQGGYGLVRRPMMIAVYIGGCGDWPKDR